MESDAHRTFENERFLVNDFYVSFLFSQGKNRTQGRYFDLLTYQYDRQRVFDTVDQELAYHGLAVMCKRLQVPGRHADLSEYGEKGDDAATTAQRQFQLQGEIFIQKLRQAPLSPSQYKHYIRKLAMSMMVMDKHYVQERRPHTKGDERKSIYREHVLRQKKVGSAVFEAILADMRAEASHRNTSYFENLAEAWEKFHPGEQFHPDELPHIS